MDFCFPQFFEVLDEDDLSIDQLESSLDRVRLQWQQSKGADERARTRKVHGFVRVDSLKRGYIS